MAPDINIWEGIRDGVKPKTYQLIEKVKGEIPRDTSLNEYRGHRPIPWQLRDVMKQRGNSWVQEVYDLCCRARKDMSRPPSHDFDRAVWAYWIEPFITGTRQPGREYSMSPLLDLLFCAVGVPDEKRNALTVSERDACLNVRLVISEIWYYQLNHLPSRLDEAAASMAAYYAHERHASLISAGAASPPQDTVPTEIKLKGKEAGLSEPLPEDPVSIQVQLNGTGADHVSSAVELEGSALELDALERRLPAGPNWKAIEIFFISDERVQIRIGDKHETLNYSEFGFEDGRNGKPNLAWATLRAMAEQEGIIRNAGNAPTWSMVEKNIQKIRKVLRDHFQISADPIPYISGTGYQASFKVGRRPSFDT